MRRVLAFLLPVLLAAQSQLLEIRVPSGQGTLRAPGSRTPGFSVQVVDEREQPASGVIVSFRLPDEGPSGTFANGLGSEIVTTGADGRAVTSAIRWNHLAGPLQVRVTAVKDRVRAGTMIALELTDAAAVRRQAGVAQPVASPRHGTRWTLVAVIAGGAVAAGFGAGWVFSRNPAQAGAKAAAPIQIGAPTITISKP
jgi:hypothetical protein